MAFSYLFLTVARSTPSFQVAYLKSRDHFVVKTRLITKFMEYNFFAITSRYKIILRVFCYHISVNYLSNLIVSLPLFTTACCYVFLRGYCIPGHMFLHSEMQTQVFRANAPETPRR